MMLVCMSYVSCTDDSAQYMMPADEPRNISFTVSLGGSRTRAPWSDEYTSDDGVSFDYRIIPNDLHVVVLADDNTSLGILEDLYYFPTNEAQTQFQFIGKMPASFVEHFNANGSTQPNYKFMVLANCSDFPSEEGYITYNYAQLDPSSESSSIPMWGVCSANMSSLIENNSLDIGAIWLLRAAAKVEVKLSEAIKERGITINSATLKYYNQTGYCLPEGWSEVDNTHELDQENCLRNYRHAAVNLPFVKDEQTGNYYVYVCEYDNKNYPEERNKISVEFKTGSETRLYEDAISFCDYSGGLPVEGSHYHIVRNHIYEFIITNISGDNLMLEYTVADWESEEWDNGLSYEEHDLTYPNYHNPVVPYEFIWASETDKESYQITKEPTMYYTGDNNNLEPGAFECFFRITTPSDVTWKPGIMGSKTDYQLRVYSYIKKDNGTADQELLFDSSIADMQGDIRVAQPGEWFRIVVFPLNNSGAGTNNIDFGISYYQEWTDQYINLFVNGEYDNIRWPESGENPKIITIKHITNPNAE